LLEEKSPGIGRGKICGALGSGSDVWKYWDEKRAGNIGERE
jgi:dihydroxy-acid dehydratase